MFRKCKNCGGNFFSRQDWDENGACVRCGCFMIRHEGIFHTDLDKLPSDTIENLRSKLCNIRGQISDLMREFPWLKERVDSSEGGLSLIIHHLYYQAEFSREIEQIREETKRAKYQLPLP